MCFGQKRRQGFPGDRQLFQKVGHYVLRSWQNDELALRQTILPCNHPGSGEILQESVYFQWS